jgi:hypothetical protein
MANKNAQSLRRAAKEVSESMAASLSQFSPDEQDRRLKAIHIAQACVKSPQHPFPSKPRLFVLA